MVILQLPCCRLSSSVSGAHQEDRRTSEASEQKRKGTAGKAGERNVVFKTMPTGSPAISLVPSFFRLLALLALPFFACSTACNRLFYNKHWIICTARTTTRANISTTSFFQSNGLLSSLNSEKEKSLNMVAT